MAKIVMYTTQICPYCMRAKALLRSKGVDFEEIDVGRDTRLREEAMRLSGGRRTVPQIFIDDRSIGGYDELWALDQAGELDQLLGSASETAE
ncbi:MAG TPA: glutaredoxin 3 [Verrucomicrobiae bacterium]|jgi:glutaredoxin 3|nr:glutaredoxin 3 [Verrucomicrobiae bacterium]